jgi:hypothetical protein
MKGEGQASTLIASMAYSTWKRRLDVLERPDYIADTLLERTTNKPEIVYG